MDKIAFVRAYRLTGCALILSATAYSFVVKWDAPDFTLVNFFSYFTQLSNLYAAAVLLAGVQLAAGPPSPRYESARGAAVVYLAVTGIVYELLLAHADALRHITPVYTTWVLHRIMPVALCADWLYVAPRAPVRWRCVLHWLAFPVAYLGYTLARGLFVDWYPYPFIDPRPRGYPYLFEYCAAIMLGGIALAALIVLLGGRSGNRRVEAGQA